MFFRVLLILFALSNVGFSQTVDNVIRGAIVGETFIPKAHNFTASVTFMILSANTIFDEDGEEVKFKSQLEDIADPKISVFAFNINGKYSLLECFGFEFNAPFVLRQALEFNLSSGYSAENEVFEGLTGPGDINLGLWYLLYRNTTCRTRALGSFQFATGSSPDEVKENEFASTGSGHTAIDFGGAFDLVISRNTFLSATGFFTINNETSYSYQGKTWDQKDGNEIYLGGRITVNASPHFSFGLETNFYSSGDVEINGKKQKNTESNSFIICPVLGYQLNNKEVILNINGRYFVTLIGDNTTKYTGFLMGINVFI